MTENEQEEILARKLWVEQRTRICLADNCDNSGAGKRRGKRAIRQSDGLVRSLKIGAQGGPKLAFAEMESSDNIMTTAEDVENELMFQNIDVVVNKKEAV